METELQRLEEGPEAIINLESLRVTLKKVPNWKTPCNDGFKNSSPSMRDWFFN